MRILINAVSAKAGGGLTYLVNLLKYLPKAMPKDKFLCVIQDISLPREIYDSDNLEIRKIKQASGNVVQRYWWENTGLIRLCNSWKADVLYCIANIAPIISTKCTKIVMIQNIAPLTPKVLTSLLAQEGILPFIQMAANSILTLVSASISKKILVLSEHSKQLLKKWLPFCNPAVVRHGISKNFTTDVPSPKKAGKDPYYIFVSNLYVYKGLEYIVEAYKHNRLLPLIYVAGQAFDRNYVNNIKNSIKENKLEDKIIFLDSLPYFQVPSWYAHAIANVFPTWCESFGYGIIEAQACGCPVVGMKVATLPELCGETGILVEPFDGKALAEGMEKAIELRKDPNLAAILVKASTCFTWEAAMEAHKRIFQSEL